MTSYRMPAEWEEQEAVWLAWPRDQKNWPYEEQDWPGKVAVIPWVYAEIIRNLSHNERVRLIVRSEKEKAHARDCLEKAGVDLGKIDFFLIPADRIWLRDFGPIFVYEHSSPLPPTPRLRRTGKGGAKKVMLDFRFNAWAKYDNHRNDDKVPARLSPLLLPPQAVGEKREMPRIQPKHHGKRVVLEGGSIDVNGRGTLLTTDECLLSDIQCRNPGFAREDYEAVFEKYLGIRHVIWLGNGIAGDDTHGHVDDISRFVTPDTIVTVVEKDKRDANHAPLHDNLKRLKAARDQHGKPLTIVELPMPKPIIFEGQRLPASYGNFLIANNLVLVPTFNDPSDRIALSILAELFPKREVVGIHAVDLVWGLGTIHCMSQQEPS